MKMKVSWLKRAAKEDKNIAVRKVNTSEVKLANTVKKHYNAMNKEKEKSQKVRQRLGVVEIKLKSRSKNRALQVANNHVEKITQ